MLRTAENYPTTDGRIEGDYDNHERWGSMLLGPTTKELRIFLGDHQSGPLVWLSHGSPKPETAAKNPDEHIYPHLHRTPTFRIAFGHQPEQMRLNNRWYGEGDYFLLDANKIYTDPNGARGFKTLLIFADRRGMHPAMKPAAEKRLGVRPAAGMSSDELIAWNRALFGDLSNGLQSLHTADADAIAGAAITTRAQLDHGGQASGCIYDQWDWAPLADGSRIAAAFMGDAAGPMVIMSQNSPHAIETPAGRCGSDMLRLILRGGCRIGERLYEAGSFVATEAGAPLEAVEHGPNGSTQLLVVSDRRHWAPVDNNGAPLASARLSEMAEVLDANVQKFN